MNGRTTRWLAAGLLVVGLTLPAFGSGFSIYEQGAKASGQAVAFVARADDPSAGFYNPAAITKLEGTQFYGGFSLVFIGDSQIDVLEDTPSQVIPWLFDSDTGAPLEFTTTEPVFRAGKWDMEDNIGVPPHLFVTHNFDGPLAISGSITAPFGLVTEWSKDSGVRFGAQTSDLETVVAGAALAYDLGGGWSVSAGLDYAMADLKEFSRQLFYEGILVEVPGGGEIPFGSAIGAVPYPAPPDDPIFAVAASPLDSMRTGSPLINLTGDGEDLSWNLSVHYRGDKWAFGAIYRDGYEIDIEGEFSVTGNPDPTGMIPIWAQRLDDAGDFLGVPISEAEALEAATTFANLPPIQDAFGAFASTTPASGVLNLPATWAMGIAYLGFENLELEFNIHGIFWSDFEEVRVEGPGSELLAEIPEDWDDTLSFRVGGAYDLNERNQVRAGVYWEQNPIPDDRVRPSIPDNDRTGITLGYGYNSEKWYLDAYLMHIEVSDRTIGVDDFIAEAEIDFQPTVPPGKWESTTDLIGVSFGYRFN
jgi:long-chain fatty acid transport protein